LSSERQKRLGRLVDLRTKELDECVGDLAEARRQESVAALALEAAIKKTQEGLAERARRAREGASVTDWSMSEMWLTQLTKSEQTARLALASAERGVELARKRVAEARAERDKMQMLVEKAIAEAKLDAKRVLQKAEDEFATARVSLLRDK
jgi:flagellar export protein FliJ